MFGNALFHPQASSLVREFNEKNPKISLFMGIFLGLGTLGYATGPYLGAFICERFGYEKVFYTFIVGLIYAIFMYFYVPKMHIKEQIIKEKFSTIILTIFKNKVCALLFVISMMKSIVSICYSTFLPFLLQDEGYKLSKIGIIITLFFIAGGIASFTSSHFEKKIGTKNTIALSMNAILPLTVAFLILLKHSFVLSMVCFVLIGYFILLSVGIILNQAQRAIPKYTGVISGIIQGAGWGIGALFLTPMGWFSQHFGIDKILILISAFAFVIGIYSIKSDILKN